MGRVMVIKYIIFKQEGEDNKNDVISIGIDTTTDDDGSTNYTLN